MFRARNGGISTYICNKVGLSNTFIKAKVMEDKITVRPHNRHVIP
mgnify:CR=1 FL=1